VLGYGQIRRRAGDAIPVYFGKAAAPRNLKLLDLARRANWSVRGILDHLAPRVLFILPDPIADV
jgi:hypothetical protein